MGPGIIVVVVPRERIAYGIVVKLHIDFIDVSIYHGILQKTVRHYTLRGPTDDGFGREFFKRQCEGAVASRAANFDVEVDAIQDSATKGTEGGSSLATEEDVVDY